MRSFAVLLLLTVACGPLWGEEFRPRVEIAASLLTGDSTELVLRDGTYHDPVSRLVWPIPLSANLGLTGELPWTTWTSTIVGLSASLPFTYGTMVDEDWRADDLVYGRSESPTYLMSHWSARVEQGFHVGDWTFGAGWLYRWMNWEAWGGKGTYLKSNNTEQKQTFSGLVLAYRQQWHLPYVSVAWEGALDDRWVLRPSGRLGPYSYGLHLDNHFLRELAFLDQVWGGLYGQLQLEVSFRADRLWGWGVRAATELAWGAVGETLQTSAISSTSGAVASFTKTIQKPGAWFRESSISFFVRN